MRIWRDLLSWPLLLQVPSLTPSWGPTEQDLFSQVNPLPAFCLTGYEGVSPMEWQ